MCRSSGNSKSEFTSSLSFGEIRERLQCRSKPGVVVSLISASDEEASVRKRLTYSENGFEKTRPKNKYGLRLRTRVHEVERFNPWALTPAEIERQRQKRLKQSLKELEDDASTALKDFNWKLDEMLELEAPPDRAAAVSEDRNKYLGGICEIQELNDRDSVAEQDDDIGEMFVDLGETGGRKSKSKLQSIMKRKASKKRKANQEYGGTFEEMLYHINEDLRSMPSPTPPGPGDGKVRKRGRGRPRKYDSQGRTSLSKAKLVGHENAALNGSPVVRGGAVLAVADLTCKNPFAIASDDPIWSIREDFFLPFTTLPRITELKQQSPNVVEFEQESTALPDESSKSQHPKAMRAETEQADSDSSTSGDIIALGVCRGSNEFDAKLKEELGRPFSMAELEEKSETVNLQKPVVRRRDLRGERSVEFSTHKEGLSYLDHHPDFAKVLGSAAANPEEELKLLRGFFFWIEHACMEGSFQPWVKQIFNVQGDENHPFILIDD